MISASASTKPGSVVRVHDQISASNFIPYCNMSNSQLSLHRYADAVKFFIAMPGQASSVLAHDDELLSYSSLSTPLIQASNLSFGDVLVVSGGDGHIDLRAANRKSEDIDNGNHSHKHGSYLIIWNLDSS